jgi:hypothetical protein
MAPLMTGCRDRTAEFMAVAERLRSQARRSAVTRALLRVMRSCAQRPGLFCGAACVRGRTRARACVHASTAPPAGARAGAWRSARAGVQPGACASPLLPARPQVVHALWV